MDGSEDSLSNDALSQMRVPLNRNVIRTRFNWPRVVLLALFAIAAFAVVIFGLRTYRSFLLLHSAYELGAPDVASLRAWMTLDYVARTYRVPGTELMDGLDLSSNEDPNTTLRSLAERQGVPPFQYIQQAQETISRLRPITLSSSGSDGISEPDALGDGILAALLVYGYPMLGLTLMLGAVGVPFPSALSVVVAGSLAAQGQMSWLWAGAVVVASSVLGDLAGYGL